MNGLFKCHAGDQGVSVEGETKIVQTFGRTSMFGVQNIMPIHFLNKPNQLKAQTNGSMLL